MLLTLLALGANAATLTVCASSCDHDDLGAAIAAANGGDDIDVGAGTWSVSAIIDKDLTIRGTAAGTTFFDSGPGNYAFVISAPVSFTLEDAQFGYGEGRILQSVAAADVTLRRIVSTGHNPEGHLVKVEGGGSLTVNDASFTGFMHGYAVDGAVFWIGNGATSSLESVTIDDAHAYRGGAIYYSDGVHSLTSCTISNSSGIEEGGAIYIDYAGQLTVDDCDFIGNSSLLSGGHIDNNGVLNAFNSSFSGGEAQGYLDAGGAIAGPTYIENCDFTGNTASWEGGALFIRFPAQIVDSDFSLNTAPTSGGAIMYQPVGPDLLTISGCTFTDNQTTGANSYGGAVYAGWGGDIEVIDTVFERNISEDYSGALHHQGPGNTVISNCLFRDNSVTDAGGGAFARMYSDGTVVIDDSTFEGNHASKGGAIEHFGGGIMTVRRSVFCGNDSDSDGAAISLYTSGSYATEIDVRNTVFASNVSIAGAGAIHGRSGFNVFRAVNNDFLDNQGVTWGSATAAWQQVDVDLRNNLYGWNTGAAGANYIEGTSGTLTLDHNAYWQNTPGDVSGLQGAIQGNDVHDDPMLSDFSPGMACGTWNLEPLPGSPLLDAGDPTETDSDGSPSDIGVSGGSDGTSTPGWTAPTTGTGTGAGTGTGTGGTTTGSWTAPGTGTGGTFTDHDGDGHAPPWDCDDSDPAVHPDAREIANDRKDNDCDGRELDHWLGGRTCSQGGAAPIGAWLGLALLALGMRRRP